MEMQPITECDSQTRQARAAAKAMAMEEVFDERKEYVIIKLMH